MRLEARLSYALLGLVQATGSAGGLDFAFLSWKAIDTRAKRDWWVQTCIWLSRIFVLFGFWSQVGLSKFAPTPYTFWRF